jgi:hypothetical protein
VGFIERMHNIGSFDATSALVVLWSVSIVGVLVQPPGVREWRPLDIVDCEMVAAHKEPDVPVKDDKGDNVFEVEV